MIGIPAGDPGGSLRQRWTTNALSPSQSNSTSPPAPGIPTRQRPISGSSDATAGAGVGGVMSGFPFFVWELVLSKTASGAPVHRSVFDDHCRTPAPPTG